MDQKPDDDDDDLRAALDERHARKTQYKRYPDRLERPEWHRWYGLARWQKIRRHFLRTHQCCVMCEESGFVVEATVVDHIVPPRGDEKLFWNQKNLQALCLLHHNSHKQQAEKGNKGYVCDIDESGWPSDRNHPVNVAGRKIEEREAKRDEDEKRARGKRSTR